MVGFYFLVVNTSQIELRLCLGEQHGWPFYPEQWQPHDYSGYFRW
jgi:hypothetical protein